MKTVDTSSHPYSACQPTSLRDAIIQSCVSSLWHTSAQLILDSSYLYCSFCAGDHEKYWQVADEFWLSLFYLSMTAQQTSLKLWLQCVLFSFPSVTDTKEQLCWWHFQFRISEVSIRMSGVAKVTKNHLPTRRSASKVAHRFLWQGKTGDWLGSSALCATSHFS